MVSLVFLAGAVSGYFFGAQLRPNSSPDPKTLGQEESEILEPSHEDRIMSWLHGFLDLEASQVSEIRPLVRLALREYHQLEKEQDARIDALVLKSDLRIAEHLSESQAKKLLDYNQAKRERRDAVIVEEEAGLAASKKTSKSD